MKKEILLALVIMVILAYSCKRGEGQRQAGSELQITSEFIGNANASPENTVTISIGIDETPGSQYPSRKEYVVEHAKNWVKNHPEAKIIYSVRPQGDINAYMAKAMVEISSKTSSDILHVDSFFVGNFLDAGYFQAIDGLMSPGDVDDFFPYTKEVTSRDGQQYTLWSETDVRFMYYNTDFVPEPPRTWDSLIKTASELAKSTGIYGFMIPMTNEGVANEGWWPFYRAMDGEIFDEAGGWKPVLGTGGNRQKMIDIFNFYRELVDTGAAPELITSIGMTEEYTEASQNNVAMFIAGSWSYAQLKDITAEPSKWKAAPFPQQKAEYHGNSAGGWNWAVITEDPVKQKIGYSYLDEMITGKKAMLARTKAYGYIPTRKSVFEDPFYSSDPFMSQVKEELKYATPRPATPLYPELSQFLQEAYGQFMINKLTAEQAVDQIQEKAMEAWKRYYRNK